MMVVRLFRTEKEERNVQALGVDGGNGGGLGENEWLVVLAIAQKQVW